MPFTVESHFPDPAMYRISGNAHVHEGGTNTPPTTILHAGEPARVHFRWSQAGWLCHLLTGHWHCNVYFEKFGPDESRAFPTRTERVVSAPANYSASIDISGLAPGIYKCISTLILYSNGAHTTPVHAFDEIGVIQVVERSV